MGFAIITTKNKTKYLKGTIENLKGKEKEMRSDKDIDQLLDCNIFGYKGN